MLVLEQELLGPDRFCTNCTGRLMDTDHCEDCGHCATLDADLFSIASSASTFRVNLQRTVLAYDERMELHAEGGYTPHPERPDRIRACVARILSSGLAGGEGVLVRMPLLKDVGGMAITSSVLIMQDSVSAFHVERLLILSWSLFIPNPSSPWSVMFPSSRGKESRHWS